MSSSQLSVLKAEIKIVLTGCTVEVTSVVKNKYHHSDSQYNPHRVLFWPLLYTIIFIDTVYVLKNSVVWSKEVYVEGLNTAENVGNEPA